MSIILQRTKELRQNLWYRCSHQSSCDFRNVHHTPHQSCEGHTLRSCSVRRGCHCFNHSQKGRLYYIILYHIIPFRAWCRWKTRHQSSVRNCSLLSLPNLILGKFLLFTLLHKYYMGDPLSTIDSQRSSHDKVTPQDSFMMVITSVQLPLYVFTYGCCLRVTTISRSCNCQLHIIKL